MYIVYVSRPYIGMHKWLSWDFSFVYVVEAESKKAAANKVIGHYPELSSDVIREIKNDHSFNPHSLDYKGYGVAVIPAKDLGDGVNFIGQTIKMHGPEEFTRE